MDRHKATRHELTQEFLVRAIGVEIRRVDEVSACLAVGLATLHYGSFARSGLK
jgi:hypothetical protein